MNQTWNGSGFFLTFFFASAWGPDVQPAWQVWPGPGTRSSRLKRKPLENLEPEMLLKCPNDVALDAAGVRTLLSVFSRLLWPNFVVHGMSWLLKILIIPMPRFHISQCPPMILSQPRIGGNLLVMDIKNERVAVFRQDFFSPVLRWGSLLRYK